MPSPPCASCQCPALGTESYVGRCAPTGGTGVWAVGRHVVPLVHHRRWSDTPLSWGAVTPGSVELAAAVLHDHAAVHVARSTAASFARDLLTGLPADGFVLRADDVRLWLDLADLRDRPRTPPAATPQPVRRSDRPEHPRAVHCATTPAAIVRWAR